jgi:hypothetical protein
VNIEFTDKLANGCDKSAVYGWSVIDKPGRFMWINKKDLSVHPDYQRDPLLYKVAKITAEWSWVACGVLVVANRGGKLWIIDGQHRYLGSLRRSDIQELPCFVFETSSIQEEAKGFLNLNTNRKAVSSVSKHKAMFAAGDETADIVTKAINEAGLKINGSSCGAGDIKSLGWCQEKAKDNPGRFRLVIAIAAKLSLADSVPVKERLLDGLWYLDKYCSHRLNNEKMYGALVKAGAKLLISAAEKSAVIYAKGSGKIYATGMLEVLNKGLRKRFHLRVEAQ